MAQANPQPSPILAVGAVIYRRDKAGQLEFLLIKKRLGYWTLPKGRIKAGESEEQALVREIQEETGLLGPVGAQVSQVSYQIVKKGQLHWKYVAYYLMRAEGGVLRPGSEEAIRKVRWFPARAAIRRIRRGRVRKVALRADELLRASP